MTSTTTRTEYSTSRKTTTTGKKTRPRQSGQYGGRSGCGRQGCSSRAARRRWAE